MLYSDTYISYFVSKNHLSRTSMAELEQVHDRFLEKLERWLVENLPDHFDAHLENKLIEKEEKTE